MKKETEFENWINLIKSSEQGSYQLACAIANKDLRKEFKATYRISFLYYKIIRFEREWHRLGINGLYLFKLDLEEYLQAGNCYYTKNALLNLQFFIDQDQQPKPSDLCE